MGEKVELKKQITLFHGVAIIVGIIIGSGIFVSPVGILQNVKSVGMSFVLWSVCGLYNMLCAICYAELGTTFPESGGEYIYIKRAFGDYAGYVCLFINFLIICPVGMAAGCLIFSTYVLQPLFPDCPIPEPGLRMIAALIIFLLIALNSINVTWATKAQVVITGSKLIALATIIVIGIVKMAEGDIDNFKNPFEGSDYSAGAIAISFYSGFWAYSGWSYLNFLTDELIDPNRNLPLSILISMVIVIVVYLVANVAYLAVLSPLDMLQSAAVAVTFADRTMGVMAWLMPILIAISVMGMMNGVAMGMSRLFYVGANNGHLPSIMGMINYKQFTPIPSLLMILILTLLYQSSNDIFFLIEMEGFGFACVLTLVFAGQVYLRFKEPNLVRPIKVPVALPAILCLISLSIVILTFIQKPTESLMALGMVAIGSVLYLVCCRWTSKPAAIQDKIDGVTQFIQKLLLVVPPDNSDQVNWD